MRSQVARLCLRDPDDAGLGQVVEEGAPVVLVGGAVGDLHHQAAAAGHQQRQRVPAGDDVRVHRLPLQQQAVLEWLLPQRLVPHRQRISTPDVVDQDVEPAVLLGVDPRHQLADPIDVQVVGGHRDAVTAGGGDQFGGLLDGLGAVHRRSRGRRAASGDVHGRPGRTELDGYPPAPATGGSAHEGDLSGQWSVCHWSSLLHRYGSSRVLRSRRSASASGCDLVIAQVIWVPLRMESTAAASASTSALATRCPSVTAARR